MITRRLICTCVSGDAIDTTPFGGVTSVVLGTIYATYTNGSTTLTRVETLSPRIGDAIDVAMFPA